MNLKTWYVFLGVAGLLVFRSATSWANHAANYYYDDEMGEALVVERHPGPCYRCSRPPVSTVCAFERGPLQGLVIDLRRWMGPRYVGDRCDITGYYYGKVIYQGKFGGYFSTLCEFNQNPRNVMSGIIVNYEREQPPIPVGNNCYESRPSSGRIIYD